MTILYIVQAEEGSGIPGTPEVFVDEDRALVAYKLAWAEALGVYDPYGEGTLDERLAQFEKDWAGEDLEGDFESEFWPEDGGVRMWAVDVDFAIAKED